MMDRSQAPPPTYSSSSSSSSSSSTETTREGKRLPKIEEIIDEGIEELEEQDDERIERWSKRFEGEEGTKLLHQLCDLVDVDIAQPRPVVLRLLAKVHVSFPAPFSVNSLTHLPVTHPSALLGLELTLLP